MEAINDLWVKFMDVRSQIAKNAGKPSYREFAWQQKLRFDYTSEDCKSFAAAIEQVVVPAATRIYQKRKQSLGLDSLRPWDLVDGWYSRPSPPAAAPTLKPFTTIDQLKAGADLSGTTYKVHLDGHNQLPYLTGETEQKQRKPEAVHV